VSVCVKESGKVHGNNESVEAELEQ